MQLLDLLPDEHVVVPLRAPSLRGAILELVQRLDHAGVLRNPEPLAARVRAEPVRDVADVPAAAVVPHYRSDATDRVILALGLAPQPLEWEEGPDGAMPRVVALVLAPPDCNSLYLQTTSTVTRLLRRDGVIEALLGQTHTDGVRRLPQLQDVRIQHSVVVRDVMHQQFRSVPPEWTVRRTLDLMLGDRIHALPVVGDKGEVLGMITDTDIMRALLPKMPRDSGPPDGEDPDDQPVRTIMSRSVLCVSEDLSVNEVATMMVNKDVKQVPVVHAGTVAGMVYRDDIIRKLFERT